MDFLSQVHGRGKEASLPEALGQSEAVPGADIKGGPH